jgi:hypothetical protein
MQVKVNGALLVACGGVCSVLDVRALSCVKTDCEFLCVFVDSRILQSFTTQ